MFWARWKEMTADATVPASKRARNRMNASRESRMESIRFLVYVKDALTL